MLQIQVLAGKGIDGGFIGRLLAGIDHAVVRYASVSRGVRRLEDGSADAVVVMPDREDASWPRALERIRHEYGLWSILIVPGGEDVERQALDVGAFDAFDSDTVKPRQIARSLRHLLAQRECELEQGKKDAFHDWIEKTGRLGFWEMDERGNTVWSEGIRRILKDEAGRLTDEFTSVRQFVHPDDLDVYDQANRTTFEMGWPLDFEYRVIVGDGEVRYLHLHRRVIHGRGGKVSSAYGMVRDVTAEREFEHFLFRRDAVLQVVGGFAQYFLRESDWENGIGNAMQRLGKAAEVSRAFIFRKASLSDNRSVMSMIHEWTAGDIVPLLGRPEVKNHDFSPTYDRWLETLSRSKTIAGHVRNFQTEERHLFEQTGTKSILLVPIFVGSQWWGFIGVAEHREERDWLPVEIESLSMVADIFGSAILRRSMEDQLMEANREAEDAKIIALEANKAKSRFLANMSHEIRTPISGILGMAEMTVTTGLTSEQREHVDMIRDSARSLLSIINDVLDISKIEAEKLELKPEDFDFRTELETVIRPFNPEAERKGVLLRYSVADDVPGRVHGDPDRLGQILRNLIGNAMKFTERGFVEMAVETAGEDSGRTRLRFTVRDTGEGIPKDKLDTIFDSFTQVDSSVRKKHQGTGLGLTISRELVRMMGGDISVESEPGMGSTFTFTAWFDACKVAEVVGETAVAAIPKTLHLNLLLAEDNPLNQKFLTHFLSMFGHKVTVANNGIEALEILSLKGRELDVVLMDIQMPEMGGIEASRLIRESDGKNFDPNIPIIALTAYAMKGDKERMLEAGMSDYVSKPVDMKELSGAIARNMEGRTVAASAPASSANKAVRKRVESDGQVVDLDMESLIKRFDGNMVLLKDILDLFLSEADTKLVRLDAGVKSGDPKDLAMTLHSITNLASHVQAIDVVAKSRLLEKQCYSEPIPTVISGVMELRSQFVALVQAVKANAKTL